MPSYTTSWVGATTVTGTYTISNGPAAQYENGSGATQTVTGAAYLEFEFGGFDLSPHLPTDATISSIDVRFVRRKNTSVASNGQTILLLNGSTWGTAKNDTGAWNTSFTAYQTGGLADVFWGISNATRANLVGNLKVRMSAYTQGACQLEVDAAQIRVTYSTATTATSSTFAPTSVNQTVVSGAGAWGNINNALTSNFSDTQATTTSTGTNNLEWTYSFTGIGSGDFITGITVNTRVGSAGNNQAFEYRLLKNGVVVAIKSGAVSGQSPWTFGGASDPWGGGLTGADFASGNVKLQAQFLGASGMVCGIDFADIVVNRVAGSAVAPTDTTAPVIQTNATQSINENASFSITLTADETVTWTKVGGSDAALFTLSGAALSMTAKDFEAPVDSDANNVYAVTVRATDAAGNWSEKTISVTILNVADTDTTPPTITSSASPSVAENTVNPTGTLTADETVTWTKVGGADQALFSLSGSTWTLNATPDFETKASYQVIWRATDPAGNFTNQTMTLAITDVSESAPPVAGPTVPWTPADLGSTVKAWLRFDQLTGAAGSTVSSFTDNGMTLTGDATVREGFLAPGKKSIRRFEGVGTMTSTTNIGISGASPRSVFAVVSLWEPGHNTNIMAVGGQAAGMQALDLWCQSGYWAYHFNGPAVNNGGGMARDVPSIVGYMTPNGLTHELWQNGQSRGTSTTSAMNTLNAPLRLLTGVHGALPAYMGTSIDMGEVVICDTYLSRADAMRVEGYLAWKWGRVAQLPAGHRYKLEAPTKPDPNLTPAELGSKLVVHLDPYTLTGSEGADVTWTNSGVAPGVPNMSGGSDYRADSATTTGLPIVRFGTGGNNGLVATGSTITLGPKSYVLLARRTGPPVEGSVGVICANRAAPNYTVYYDGSGVINLYDTTSRYTGVLFDSNYQIIIVTYSATGEITVRSNGGQAWIGGNGPTAVNPGYFDLGFSSGTSGTSMDLREFMMTGPLTVAEAQFVEGVLAHKHDMASVLPASHPYKSSPPKQSASAEPSGRKAPRTSNIQ